jgi:hypothetical protein
MKEIIKGVVNHITQGDTDTSKAKLAICKKCPERYEDGIFGDRCAKCGCILKFKVKSDSSCPLSKW